MKLNLEKCAFGVGSGKFLGFIVSNRGIEINPDKIKAIEEITVVNNIKVVQRLTGQIAALGRFISRSSDKSHHFFALLKRENNFEWTPECQHALEELKRYLSSPPLLHMPKEDETLYLYLAVSKIAVSDVLVREEQGLELAKGLGAESVEAKCDSLLVVSQVNESYEAREDRMQRYLDNIQIVLRRFKKWTLVRVAREQNCEVDALVNLGSSVEEEDLLPDHSSTVQIGGRGSPKSDQSGLLLGQHGEGRQGIRPKMRQMLEVRSHDPPARRTTAFRFITMAIHEMGDGHCQFFADGVRETPFSLVYGVEALILVEAREPSTRFRHTSEGSNNEAMTTALELLDERREASLVQMAAQK
uniref:Uncharacterized protein LOC104210373 n=1 Tax=Nicotiana sylvestris TaxID=4096 RepID=A0A1U7V5Q7_NICSY|nr:PREDICTED: uncharacterized protein LOC104210373 [Nicotiana sylvestris]